MKKNNSTRFGQGNRFVKRFISFILILYTLITIFLLGDTVLSSFKGKTELVSNLMGFPKAPTLATYAKVLMHDRYLKYIVNSILLVSVSLVLLIIVSSMLAYGIAKYQFRGRGLLTGYLLLGLMVPVQLSILPLYLALAKLHMVNIWGLILIYAANLSFSFTVFLQFFKEFPSDMLESARIDGASDFKIFTKIVVPISRPVFATVALLQFIMIWNDFFLPMVFLTKKESFTLTLAIYNYTQNFLKNLDKIFVVVTMALVPILIFYFIFSEQIVAGLTAGSSKE